MGVVSRVGVEQLGLAPVWVQAQVRGSARFDKQSVRTIDEPF